MTDQPAVTAEADQFRAAAAEARAWAKAEATKPDSVDHAEVEGPPRWIVDFVHRHDHALVNGPRTICPHIGAHPRVAHVAHWRPGSLACTPCAEAGWLDRLATYEQAMTCAVCGNHGTAATMSGGRAQNGPFVLHFGVHKTCSWSQP